MRHEKTVSVSKIKPLWEPWEEDETPRKTVTLILLFTTSINLIILGLMEDFLLDDRYIHVYKLLFAPTKYHK